MLTSICQFGSFLADRCRRACLVRWSLRMKRRSHRGQANFFSPVCVRRCRDSSSERANLRSQPCQLQLNGFSPVCVLIWAFRWELLKYVLPQPGWLQMWLRILEESTCGAALAKEGVSPGAGAMGDSLVPCGLSAGFGFCTTGWGMTNMTAPLGTWVPMNSTGGQTVDCWLGGALGTTVVTTGLCAGRGTI